MTRRLLIIAALATALFQSCGDGFKTSEDGFKTSEDGFKTSEDGLKYKIHTSKKIKVGDFVTLNMVYRTDSDSVLFDTYRIGETILFKVKEPSFKGDLMHGLTLLSESDSATFLINADSLFEKTIPFQRPAFIAAGSMLTFQIKIEKVQSKKQMEDEMQAEAAKKATVEKANINKYIADNKLTTVITASGVQYVITKKGTTKKASFGDTVMVQYTGRLLNGFKFDSSYPVGKPLEYPLGQVGMIKGWDEILQIMGKGAKATVIIPYAMAYGGREMGNGAIPAYSTLVFEMELVGIKKAKK